MDRRIEIHSDVVQNNYKWPCRSAFPKHDFFSSSKKAYDTAWGALISDMDMQLFLKYLYNCSLVAIAFPSLFIADPMHLATIKHRKVS